MIEKIEKIFEFIIKIPAMVEFIIGSIVYLIIYSVASTVVSGVAEGTVCKTSGFESWFLCFILTNEFVSFLSIVGVIILIGLTFRYKFLR